MPIPRMLAIGVIVLLTGCRRNQSPEMDKPESGIALTLATDRAQAIADLRYNLSFSIPADASQPIQGQEEVRFRLQDASRSVILDFEPGAESIRSLSAGGRPVPVTVVNSHIVIPAEFLASGENRLEIAFR